MEAGELPGRAIEVGELPGVLGLSSLPLPQLSESALTIPPPVREERRSVSMNVSKLASVTDSVVDFEKLDKQHPLVHWFESEVRPELNAIHRKLDLLVRPGGRRNTKKATFALKRATTTTIDVNKFASVMPRTLSVNSAAEGRSTPALAKLDKLEVGDAQGGLHMVLSSRPSKMFRMSMSRHFSDPESEADADEHGMKSEDVAADNTPRQTTAARQTTTETNRVRHGSEHDFRLAQQAAIFHSRMRNGFEMLERIWGFLEDPDSSQAARVFAIIQPFFITATVLLTLLQTPLPPLVSGSTAALLEISCDAIFLFEFLLRVATSPNPKVFLCSYYALIDFMAACPLALRLAAGPVLPDGPVQTVPHGLLLFAVPLIRMLKTLRRFQKLHLLLKAFNLAAEALPVLLFILFTIAFFFSVLIYLAESENMKSLPTAFWFTIVTMTTVGYGDISPTTDAGICVTSVLIIVTVLYMAIPLGIVGEAFAMTWQDRDRILLMQRTRERLYQWGYTASDIPVLFRLSDENDDGDLSLGEFRQLLNRMKIGFSDERVMKLFNSLDSAQTGAVDAKAFVRGLFPEAYHEIFDEEDTEIVATIRQSRAERRSVVIGPPGQQES